MRSIYIGIVLMATFLLLPCLAFADTVISPIFSSGQEKGSGSEYESMPSGSVPACR